MASEPRIESQTHSIALHPTLPNSEFCRSQSRSEILQMDPCHVIQASRELRQALVHHMHGIVCNVPEIQLTATHARPCLGVDQTPRSGEGLTAAAAMV